MGGVEYERADRGEHGRATRGGVEEEVVVAYRSVQQVHRDSAEKLPLKEVAKQPSSRPAKSPADLRSIARLCHLLPNVQLSPELEP